jgi:hypothetical protein
MGTKAVHASYSSSIFFNRALKNSTRGDDAQPAVIPQWVVNTTAVAVLVVFISAPVVGTQSLGPPHVAVVLTSIKVV